MSYTTGRLNNRAKKMIKAHIHNESMAIINNMLTIGQCSCDEASVLAMYLKSEPDNRLKYYCSDCKKTSDITKPDEGDIIFGGPQQLINFLRNHYDDPTLGVL
jgi:hypothetical protein